MSIYSSQDKTDTMVLNRGWNNQARLVNYSRKWKDEKVRVAVEQSKLDTQLQSVCESMCYYRQ